MRQLSKFEQNLISQMTDINWQGNLSIPNLLDKLLEGVRIIINKEEKSVDLLFEIQNKIPTDFETKKIIDRVPVINEIIVTTVNLLNLLEKEGYIVLFESSNIPEKIVKFGQGASNLPSISYKFPDNRTSELLVKYCTPQIVVSGELIEYRNSRFRTREDRRHYQNIRLAWFGISVSIVATIFSLFFSTYDSFIKDDTSDCICPILTDIKNESIKTNDSISKMLIIERKSLPTDSSKHFVVKQQK